MTLAATLTSAKLGFIFFFVAGVIYVAMAIKPKSVWPFVAAALVAFGLALSFRGWVGLFDG